MSESRYRITVCSRCGTKLSLPELGHPQPYCWPDDAEPPTFTPEQIAVVPAAEAAQLREALRGLLAYDYQSDEDPGPIFDRARAALGDTPDE